MKEERSCGREDDRRALFTIYINMLAVSSEVSIQGRYDLTVHTQPMI